MKKLYSCGDSFMSLDTRNTGITHFTTLLADKLGYEHTTLGKSGASNFCIRLQIEHAIEHNADFVIVGASGSRRIDFNLTGSPLLQPVKLTDVVYNDYKSASQNNITSGGSIISDSLNNFTTSNFEWVPHDNFKRGVSQLQIDAMVAYETQLHDQSIWRTRDYFIIESGLRRLKDAAIPFVFFPGPLIGFDWDFIGDSLWSGTHPWDMPNGIDTRDIAHNSQDTHNTIFSELITKFN